MPEEDPESPLGAAFQSTAIVVAVAVGGVCVCHFLSTVMFCNRYEVISSKH